LVPNTAFVITKVGKSSRVACGQKSGHVHVGIVGVFSAAVSMNGCKLTLRNDPPALQENFSTLIEGCAASTQKL
jgi:hypothetical protein